MERKVGVLLMALVLVSAALEGCTGALDLKERSLATLLGFDSEGERIRVSASIPAVEKQAGGEGGGGGPSSVTVTAEGPSSAEAVSGLQSRLDKPLFLGHVRVILLGEELAKKGINEAFSYLTRHPELRGLVWVAVARGKVEELVGLEIPTERLTAIYLDRLLRTAHQEGQAPDSRFGSIAATLSTAGVHPVVPILKVEGKRVCVDGAAVFLVDRMVGELTLDEVSDIAVIGSGPRAGIYSSPSPRGGGRIYVRIISPRTRVRVANQPGGRPRIELSTRMEAQVVEDSGQRPGEAGAVAGVGTEVRAVERDLEAEVARRLEQLIHKVQRDMGADVFGFGKHAGRAFDRPWDEVFPDAQVSVKTQVRIRRLGLGGA